MATYNEAVEVKSEDALRDLQLFSAVTQEIRKIMEQVAVLKTKTPEKWKEMAQQLRIEGSFHFLTLKKLNRMAQIRSKNAKDETTEAKQKLDENNLHLQNLQYEICHLNKEINNCLQFKSNHEDVDLVELEQFYKDAPKEISQPEATMNDEHMQMLARLDWELESRKNLDTNLKGTHEKKEALLECIKKKKQDLDSLRPNLQTILKSTMPLQEALGDHFTEKRALNNNAYLLPQPLYVLFIQSKAFSEGCNYDIETQIGGDLDAASRLKNASDQRIIDATNLYRNTEQEESDSENDDDQESQSARRRSMSVSTEKENKSSSSISTRKHPLYVSLKIFLEEKSDDSPYLLLRFYHYSDPELVAVMPSLELSKVHNSIKNHGVLSSSSLLHDLQEIDNGKDILKRKSDGEEAKKVKLTDSEKAYLWAQKLTGLDALENGANNAHEERFSNMRLIVRLLRHRVNARLALADQLVKFKLGTVECDLSITSSYAPSLSFNLAAWRPIDFTSYCSLGYTNAALELGLVDNSHFLFLGTLQRGSTANAEVAIAISKQYPKKWPLLNVCLQWRGEHTAENNLNIREIEVEVNCRVPEAIHPTKKYRNSIVSYQIYRLLSMLDVYVETDSNTGGSGMPSEFPTTKLCPRTAKGRSRLKPYSYNPRYKFQCY